MIENTSRNKKYMQLRFVLKIKDLKNKIRRINLKLIVISIKINSERATEKFLQAILSHTALYEGGLFITRASRAGYHLRIMARSAFHVWSYLN